MSNQHHSTHSEWETVIGLEVHVQLATCSKIFSGSSTCYGAEPNTQANAIDMGLPGVLPVLNHQALNMAIKFGVSIDAHINKTSVFARKNYFYPDSPKGYQITQHELPIVGVGHLDITLADGSDKRINITRAHLEEDAGKSIHQGMHGATGIDLNRAGTPLLEVVSEPDMRSAQEAVAYLKHLHQLVRHIEICDGNMQEGSFRCDANVSIRKRGTEQLGTRTEIKNVNSFRFVEQAIEYEVERQIDILEDGGSIQQETRLYDPDRDETRSMRSKEEAHDYRYFPDPDLLPVQIDDDYIAQIKAQLPEMPQATIARFIQDFALAPDDATFLVNQKELAEYFESACQATPAVPAKMLANWIMGDMNATLGREKINISACPITPQQLGQLVLRIHDQTISHSIAKKVFQDMWQEGASADAIIEKKGLRQINDDAEINTIIQQILHDNPNQLQAYLQGKIKLLDYFFGQLMKITRGRANPSHAKKLLQQELEKAKKDPKTE